MKESFSQGQDALLETVINKGLCVTCGACVDLCPYFTYVDGRVIVMDRCRAGEGSCFRWCPQAPWKTGTPDTRGREEREGIGPFIAVFAARSRDPEKRASAQNGGVVTALMKLALECGVVESVIVTGRGDGGSPMGERIDSSGRISAVSGSRYTASAALAALNRAEKEGVQRIGVIGVPCQMAALERRGRYLAEKGLKDPVLLRIGLFCTWALDYRRLSAYLTQKGLKGPLKKADIPPPPAEVFRVSTAAGAFEYPLPEVRALIQKGCSVCRDMTALHGDISVGAFEGREGWNTVIIRTESGKALFDQAVEKGKVESEPFPEENLHGLNRAALGKKKRGAEAYRQMIGEENGE